MALTAQAIVDRMKKSLGAGWKSPSHDTFIAGSRDTDIKGVATTFAPSVEVLKKAVASGKNLIVCRESPYWSRPTGLGLGAAPSVGMLENDPVYRWKRDYIAANNLVVYRFFQSWDARVPDGQLQGLAKALGWESKYKPSGGQPWATGNGFFALTPTTLRQAAVDIKKTLKTRSIRVGGDPAVRVSKAAVWPGICTVGNLQKMLAEPGVDLVVMGEPEWEIYAGQYNFDLEAAGIKKGIVYIGQEASEEPGAGEMATWLKSLVSEVPVEWISTGEPSWMARQA